MSGTRRGGWSGERCYGAHLEDVEHSARARAVDDGGIRLLDARDQIGGQMVLDAHEHCDGDLHRLADEGARLQEAGRRRCLHGGRRDCAGLTAHRRLAGARLADKQQVVDARDLQREVTGLLEGRLGCDVAELW